MIDAYPLQWPPGWPRAKYQSRHGSMVRSFTRSRDGIISELELLGAKNPIINTNLETRLDGLPYAKQRAPEDVGVAVYFTLNGEQQCIPCDKWDNIEQNLRAIEMTINALRGIERWGAKEMVNAAFRGFKALPSSTIVTPYQSRLWYEVLEVSPNASPEVIKAAYRQIVLKNHPDHGGNVASFHEVQKAYKEATS